MKLYHKQLNSLKELRLERELLKASIGKSSAVNHTTTSIPEDHSRSKGKDVTDVLIDILSNELVLDVLLKFGTPLLKKTGEFSAKNLFKLGKEVLGGYAKWKALEISYRWARRHLFNKKTKAE